VKTTSWPTPLRTAWISSATRPAAGATTARTLTGAFSFCVLMLQLCNQQVYFPMMHFRLDDNMPHTSFNAQGTRTAKRESAVPALGLQSARLDPCLIDD